MAKMKQCRECKADIPAGAKKCMHCGSKQGVGCLGAVVAILFTFMVIGIVAGQVGKSPSSSTPQTPAQKKAAAAEYKARAEASAADSLCMRAVRASAKFPSSVDFKAFSSTSARPMRGGGYVAEWAFEAKNGMGNTLPQMAHCEVKGGRLAAFSVRGR
ncbi:MAG TPA: hypothetical protein VKA31_05980 [Mariprofundaceae bacterium]|nr:hypothetical protein [Mariprofundaceae bacterium]